MVFVIIKRNPELAGIKKYLFEGELFYVDGYTSLKLCNWLFTTVRVTSFFTNEEFQVERVFFLG